MPDRYEAFPSLKFERPEPGILRLIMSAPGKLNAADAGMHRDLTTVWDEIDRTIKPYYHQWHDTDMLIWDNWRMLHAACGCDPKHERIMHRTTIKGDYGLGRWETDPKGAAAPQEMM